MLRGFLGTTPIPDPVNTGGGTLIWEMKLKKKITIILQ